MTFEEWFYAEPEELKAHFEKHGQRLVDVGRALGQSYSTAHQILNGYRPPDDFQRGLLAAFAVELENMKKL